MQRTLLIASFFLLLVLAGVAFWLLGSDPAGPSGDPRGGGATPVAVEPVREIAQGTAEAPADDVQRSMVAAADSALDDPEIRAGLCGFKGRVVDARKAPVADCGVRMFRGSMDTVLPDVDALFAPAPEREPEILAGEARTASDGRWLMTGVWPGGFFLLHAGLGTDAPTHQLVTRVPAPGEIVDLGDIVLQDAGVITGTVIGDDGEPLAGALVRAADVPGAIAALYPFERIQPGVVLLVREKSSPIRVCELPKWIDRALAALPIPSTQSGPDGAFRLVGVVPGSNLLATTANAHIADVKPSVLVKAGQTKDVGKVRLKAGEELVGKVVDTAGKPVVGAEVLAGSFVAMGPVDFARKLPPTDAEGRFSGFGFANGRVSVAARVSRAHEWFLAEPQSIGGDVVVVLPATFGVDIAVTLADGKPAPSARFQVLPGRTNNGAVNLHLLGLQRPVDLRDKLQPKNPGAWRITPLQPGKYTLIADAPGHATAFAEFDLIDADSKVALQLTAPARFTVRTVADDEKPVRNAMIYAEAEGTRLVQMPVAVGRTDADGVRIVDSLQAESLRVSATHPKWGTVHGEVKVGQEVVLRFQTPGSLRGVLVENGKPPAAGTFTVAVHRRRGDGEVRGPLESAPQLLTPGADGVFQVAVLQPGTYEIAAIRALDALRSPGGLVALVQDAFMMRNVPETRATVDSGRVAEARLEVGEQPIEGPTATVAGTVTVDGKLAVGYAVMARLADRQFSARTDERGHFDLRTVPAGKGEISLLGNGGDDTGLLAGPRNMLWQKAVELQSGEAREFAIEVQTSSLRGVCLLPGGRPAANVWIQGSGKLKGADDSVWIGASTNNNGEFHFAQIAEGTWSLSARATGDDPARGELRAVEAVGGVPTTGLRIELKGTPRVKGKLDLASLAARKTRWLWLEFRPPAMQGESEQTHGAGVDEQDGTFTCDDLQAGSWEVRLHIGYEDGPEPRHATLQCGSLEVPAQGLDNVLLRPGAPVVR